MVTMTINKRMRHQMLPSKVFQLTPENQVVKMENSPSGKHREMAAWLLRAGRGPHAELCGQSIMKPPAWPSLSPPHLPWRTSRSFSMG